MPDGVGLVMRLSYRRPKADNLGCESVAEVERQPCQFSLGPLRKVCAQHSATGETCVSITAGELGPPQWPLQACADVLRPADRFVGLEQAVPQEGRDASVSQDGERVNGAGAGAVGVGDVEGVEEDEIVLCRRIEDALDSVADRHGRGPPSGCQPPSD